MTRPRLLLVSPRPPRRDGQGDQRRAYLALTALAADWDVEVMSWLPDAELPVGRQWRAHPTCVLRTLALSTVLPLQVAYVHALRPWPRRHELPATDLVLYMTDRAAPRSPRRPYVIDFIDDLGGAAAGRASSSPPLVAAFWRWEGWRLRRRDARLAAGALLSVAISEPDAAAISPAVQTIHNAMATTTIPDRGTKVAFTGNLFYRPNLDAALWICDHLTPRLGALGIDPGTIVIAGRRPPAALCARALTAGIDFRPDVADLADVLAEAAVVICPVVFGSGVQNKVLDAVGAGRACVVTPFTNQAIGLEDGRSALVRERTPDGFATAILDLLANPGRRQLLAQSAREHLGPYTGEAVEDAWRRSLQSVRAAMGESH